MSTEGFSLETDIYQEIKLRYAMHRNALEVFDIRTGYVAISMLIDLANKYFDEEKPWTIKDDPTKLRDVLLNLVEILYHITVLVAPFLPQTTEKMREIFSLTDSKLAGFSIDPDFRLVQENTDIKLVTVPLLFEKI
ncbi:MAG: class I tRNA ligase family protein [Candidatus Gracilibacteria bacterium]|nr:class I tRNA ligase family protein [Candidatus Gracilibacteria bacterium]